MIENRLSDYLAHMLEAEEQARTYVEGVNKETFLADKRTQQAVILNLVIISEAARKLLKETMRHLSQLAERPLDDTKRLSKWSNHSAQTALTRTKILRCF